MLTIFGITMVRSAVAGNIELMELNLVQRQLIFAVVGLVVILITASIDYHLWSSISRTMYLGMGIILAVLAAVGAVLFGSARWFDTGVILIQPSELAKIVMIVVLADYFTHHKDQIQDLKMIARSLLLTMGIVLWILLQPNLSTTILIFVIWFAMLWAAGLRFRHLLLFAGTGLALPIVSFPFLANYQQRRILNFLFPDPEASYGEIYNIQQALIAIGSGGWFGEGYGHGSQVQLRFLKIRHTDFIFAAMAEEFGFIGTTVVMMLLLFVILRCLRAARLARDTFGGLIAYGVATMIAFQAIVNIGVNLRLVPATGLTLPFISYGGSSLLSTLLGIGLVESIIIRYKALEFAGSRG